MNKNTEFDNEVFEILDDTEVDNVQNYDTWKIIIADDDSEVHKVTKLVLGNFVFEGKSLNILSAYSEAQAKDLICQNPDTAVILLDVIMEKEDSGFNVIKYIRDELENRTVRIILRTGQPGQAPENQTIENYDINDYKEKTELTSNKLFTTLITALRTYHHITDLEHSKKGLEEIIVSTAEIFKPQAVNSFYDILLKYIISVVSTGSSNTDKISGFIAVNDNNSFYPVSSCGMFLSKTGSELVNLLSDSDYELILNCIKSSKYCFSKKAAAICFKSELNRNILVYFNRNNDLAETEKNLLSIFHSNISISLNNMELSREIESTQKEILYTLGGIAEARSKELGKHVLRVAEFSKVIALGYGMSAEEAELINQAAPMHDIGKIAILDEILNKPGKLTPEEFEVIKTHSQLGYDLLKSSNKKTLKAAAIIALQHHEKYNGTGYPGRLKGEDIHIYGRIAAIADVFDALGCNRVYKKAWKLDKILELFRMERGQHFDPVLVDILFENLDKIVQIKKALHD